MYLMALLPKKGGIGVKSPFWALALLGLPRGQDFDHSRPWVPWAHFRRLEGLERGSGGLASTPHQCPRYPAGTPRGALRFADHPFYGV